MFCRSVTRRSSTQRPQRLDCWKKPPAVPNKRLLQSLVVAAVWGVIKARQMALDHAGSHRRANGSSESLSGLSTYVIVMIIMKRHPAFFSHSVSLYTKVSTAPSLRISRYPPKYSIKEKQHFCRELLVFATTFYLLVRNRKTRRGIHAFFFLAKVSSRKIVSMSNRNPVRLRQVLFTDGINSSL